MFRNEIWEGYWVRSPSHDAISALRSLLSPFLLSKSGHSKNSHLQINGSQLWDPQQKPTVLETLPQTFPSPEVKLINKQDQSLRLYYSHFTKTKSDTERWGYECGRGFGTCQWERAILVTERQNNWLKVFPLQYFVEGRTGKQWLGDQAEKLRWTAEGAAFWFFWLQGVKFETRKTDWDMEEEIQWYDRGIQTLECYNCITEFLFN